MSNHITLLCIQAKNGSLLEIFFEVGKEGADIII